MILVENITRKLCYRSSHRGCSIKLGVLKNFAKFTRKYLCQRLFFNKKQVQPCKLYNNKYMIASTPIANTEILSFIAILVFKLLSRKDLFVKRKGSGNC